MTKPSSKPLLLAVCHLPLAIQAMLATERASRISFGPAHALDPLMDWVSRLEGTWIPLVLLCLSLLLIMKALRDETTEPMERYFWALALLINATLAAPIFYWRRIHAAPSSEPV